MSEEEERKQRRIATRVEQRTREVCGGVAGVAAVAGLLVLGSMEHAASGAIGVLQPAAAFLLATSVASAARYLGDPVGDPGRGKREERATVPKSPLRLWLGCFAAIWTAIVATQVLPGLIAAATIPAPKDFAVRAPSGSVVRVEAGTRMSRIAVRLPEGAAATRDVSVRVVR